MEPTLTSKQHVECRPGVCGGKPCIAGTRVRVQDIYVCHELRGMTPDEIVTAFPSITLADVHAALAYFWDNRDEIKRQMADEDAYAAAMQAKLGPGRLDRLTGKDVGRDAISPG